MEFEIKLLIENLKKIPEEEEAVLENRERLRMLLLVLAGDQRVIRELCLDEIEELFLDTPYLLEVYGKGVPTVFYENRLENCKCVGRRAV